MTNTKLQHDGIPVYSRVSRQLAEASFAAHAAGYIDHPTHESMVVAGAAAGFDQAPARDGGEAAGADSHSLYMHVAGLSRQAAAFGAQDDAGLHKASVQLREALRRAADRRQPGRA